MRPMQFLYFRVRQRCKTFGAFSVAGAGPRGCVSVRHQSREIPYSALELYCIDVVGLFSCRCAMTLWARGSVYLSSLFWVLG